MAKYGTFKYGTSTLYGTGAAGPQPTYTGELIWSIQFAWSGSFGPNEAGYVRGLSVRRGRRYYIAPSGNGFENFQPGTATLKLENVNRRYDPYNSDSPLYGQLKPGVLCKIKAVVAATGTEYDVFTGKIDEIKPVSRDNYVMIDLVDGWRWLQDAEISIERKFRNGVSDSIDLTLTAADYPFSRSLSTEGQPVWVYDPDKRTAASVINDLAQASLGQFFVAADGQARFYPRSYTGMTNHALDQSVLLKEIAVSQPWENIRNKVRIYANQVGKRFGETVWSYGGVMLIDGSSYVDTRIDTGDTIDLFTPRAGTDYTANSDSSGNGTDKTAYVRAELYSARSGSALLRMVNTHAYPVYVTGLRVRGSVRVNQQSSYYAEAVTSAATYGPRRFNLDNPFLQDKGYASAFSTIIRDGLQNPAKNPIIQIEQRPSVQYPIELMDKVTLTASALGISGEVYYVGQVEHEWLEETGQAVRTTVYLQNVIRNSTSITPQPYYPGQPTIETIPPNPWNPNQLPPVAPPTPPTITPGSECINDMAAPANGPYRTSLSGTLMNYDAGVGNYRYAWIYYPCYIRSANATNKTTIRMYATTQQLTNFTWQPLPESMAGFHLWAYDYSWQPVAEVVWDAVTDQGAGIRTGTISTPAATLVQFWRAIMDEDTDSGNGVNVAIAQHAIGAHNTWISTLSFSDDGAMAAPAQTKFGAAWKVTIPEFTAAQSLFRLTYQADCADAFVTTAIDSNGISGWDPDVSALSRLMFYATGNQAPNTPIVATSGAYAQTQSYKELYLSLYRDHDPFYVKSPAIFTLQKLEQSLNGTDYTQLWPASTGNKRITINYLDLYNICSKDG